MKKIVTRGISLEANVFTVGGLQRELERFFFAERVKYSITRLQGWFYVTLLVEVTAREDRFDQIFSAIEDACE